MSELLFFALTILLIVVCFVTFSNSSLSQDAVLPNVAEYIFNDKTLTLPNNVKNFVILIPNEAHESPFLPKEQRLINQPYVPQNLVIHPNTRIAWFSGDVGHTRQITLTDVNLMKLFNSKLKFNSASEPLSLNFSGRLYYFEKNANTQEPNFVMNGSITIVNPDFQSNPIENNMGSKFTFDTILVLMIPTKDIKKHTMTLDENNVEVIDQYTFKDLREAGGGGANQTLLVLGTNNSLMETTSVLKKITASLPYS